MGCTFGTNGVRGIVGEDLSLSDVHRLAAAAGARAGGRVLVGRDGRSSSKMLSGVVCSSLSYAGIACADAGLVPTPCLEYAVRELGYAGGIMVTASHNPPEYNGIKSVDADGIETPRDGEEAIESACRAGAPRARAPWGAVCAETRAIDAYSRGVLARVDAARARSQDLVIAADLGNGAQAAAAPQILGRMCKRVVLVNGTIDPEFPGRGPEPTPDNLGALSDAVRDSSADIGVAFDGDGDRSVFCDERGRVLTGDSSALLLARHALAGSSGALVTPVNSSDAADELAAESGSRVVRTRVGSVNVSRTMAGIGAAAGFEENGGFMLGRHLAVRDGCMAAALALDALASSRRALSELMAELPASHTSKAKVRCAPGLAARAVAAFAEAHPDAETLDGAKVRLAPRRWVMVRASGTEPVIRIYAESDTAAGLDELLSAHVAEVRSLINTFNT